MPRKLLLYLLVGMVSATLGGVASAEVPIMNWYSSDAAIGPSVADPEHDASNSTTWQQREPVETGSMPSVLGNSPELRCCEGESGPLLDQAGETVPRPGIDDGP